MSAFRKVSGRNRPPNSWKRFKIETIDLPLICGVNLEGKMIESQYGFVSSKHDIAVLDAWHGWKDGCLIPKILKPLVAK